MFSSDGCVKHYYSEEFFPIPEISDRVGRLISDPVIVGEGA